MTDREKFLINFVVTVNVCITTLFLLLIVLNKKIITDYTGFSFLFSIAVYSLFIISFILALSKKIKGSYFLAVITMNLICFISGLKWGYDMHSVVLGYLMSIVFVSLVSKKNISIYYLCFVILSMFVGFELRNYLNINTTWRNYTFRLDDILEFGLVFIYIVSLLFLSNREQTKLLNRSIRTEFLLKKEKELLETTVTNRTLELKQSQIEYLNKIYRFVEFGKIAQGLFHDIISPIQTLKLKIETVSAPSPHGDRESLKALAKLETMISSVRKQIKYDKTIQTFNLLDEINDLLILTKHLYVKKNINIIIKTHTGKFNISTRKYAISHILYNLFMNACESFVNENSPNKEICIHTGITENLNFISIIDTGIGINPEKIHTIFDPFQSSKRQTEDGGNNFGIGLASAKYSADRHLKGKLLCESVRGEGTTMTLLFPNLTSPTPPTPSSSPQPSSLH